MIKLKIMDLKKNCNASLISPNFLGRKLLTAVSNYMQ